MAHYHHPDFRLETELEEGAAYGRTGFRAMMEGYTELEALNQYSSNRSQRNLGLI